MGVEMRGMGISIQDRISQWPFEIPIRSRADAHFMHTCFARVEFRAI